jgi:putative ABC transport system substrate-binding protein
VFEVSRVVDFGAVFGLIAQARPDGVLTLSSPLFGGNPQLLAELAARHRLAVINQFPDFAEQGGLIGYGPELQELFRQTGRLTGKVLQGPAGAELPSVERPVRFKLVTNLKTARAMGIELPTTLLARADEVIE